MSPVKPKPTDSPLTAKGKYYERLEKHRCIYRNCCLLGSHTHTSKFYCVWHFEYSSPSNMWLIESKEEFLRWRQKTRDFYEYTKERDYMYANDDLMWQGITGELTFEEFNKLWGKRVKRCVR